MKKLITLCLAFAGMVGTVSAETKYYVVGQKALLGDVENNKEWANAPNQLTNDGDVYTFTTIRNIDAGTYEFKFVKQVDDGEWDWTSLNPNGSNISLTVQRTGTYKFTYTVNTSGGTESTQYFGIYKPTTVTFVGKGITSDTWASTETNFSAEGDSWIFQIDETTNNNVYFRFKLDGTEYCPNNSDDRWLNFSSGMTMDMKEWSSYEGTTGCFALSSFNYLHYDRYKVKITPYHDNIYMEVFAYEKATVNGSGFCTFVNEYPLTISGATAYGAEDSGNGNATAHAITDNVPAGTPMLIKGTTGETYYFEVVGSGTALSYTNAFKAGGSTIYGSDNGKFNYVLNGDAFYLAKSTGTTVASGKAYLQLSAQATARALIFPEDDETQGIEAIATVKATDGAYYNLSGQRVNAPVKGLYIQNGKKMIVK